MTLMTRKEYGRGCGTARKLEPKAGSMRKRELDDEGREGTRKKTKTEFFKTYADVLNNSRVVFKSPADFMYLGWTSSKSREVLQQSLGKVLFVDEAYGFIPRGDNMFGIEALNEITAFVDSHPREIVLIFAGYEKELRRGVFESQKGLDRQQGGTVRDVKKQVV